MRRLVKSSAALILGSALLASNAIAGPATDALAACLADSTTGKDRKDMARWVFTVMASHPDMKTLSVVKPSDREEMDKKLAALFTKLMTETCPVQARAAMEKEGAAAFQGAFSVFGQLAMQELMSNPAVNASITEFTKYLDKAKIDAVFSKGSAAAPKAQ